MKGIALYVVGSLVIWAVLAIPATIWLDANAALMAGAALFLCLVPGVVTLYWVQTVGRRSPELLMLAVLGGTFVRLLTAMGGGLVLFLAFPAYFSIAFWIWLAVFYLFTLAVEIAMLSRFGASS